MTITNRQNEILTKATDTLYWLSCGTDNKIEERDLENIAKSIERFLRDCEVK